MTFVNRLRHSEWLAAAYRRFSDLRHGHGWGAFHRDPIYRKLMLDLLEAFPFSSFVETGTYRGYSTEFVARNHPGLPIFTTEVVEDRYRLTKRALAKYPNITALLGSSDKITGELLAQKKVGVMPLYFLDAHWEKYWPLKDELRHITKAGGKAVVVIDDFEAEGQPQFDFDLDGGAADGAGVKCNFDYIREALAPSNDYRVLFPRYTRQDAYGPQDVDGLMRGHIVLFQNMADEFETYRRRPHARTHYFAYDPAARAPIASA